MGRMQRKRLQLNYSKLNTKRQCKLIQAYIMMNMYPGTYNIAIDKIKKIKNVEKTNTQVIEKECSSLLFCNPSYA